MEKIKSILLICFIVGIIGAVNTIISQSRQDQSVFTTISKILGFYQEKPKEIGRPLNYVPKKLKEGQNQPIAQNPQPSPATRSQPPVTRSQPPATSSPTPIPAIQTAPELPPLPPLGGSSLGIATDLPPLPPLPAENIKAPANQNSSEFPTLENFFGNLINYLR